MKAELNITIEQKNDEIVIKCNCNPKTIEEGGPLKVAADMIAHKVARAINEFYDDVKILHKHKPVGGKATDMEMAICILRIIRYAKRYDVDLKSPDLKDLKDPAFKAFTFQIIEAVEKALDEKHANEKGLTKSVSDSVLKERAWAQRN